MKNLTTTIPPVVEAGPGGRGMPSAGPLQAEKRQTEADRARTIDQIRLQRRLQIAVERDTGRIN
jgi:hypothetical protein